MTEHQIIANRYEIVSTIGQGGMGDVYQGRDLDTGETVAIKLLKPDIVESDPTLIERFEREGEALRRLNHPNIVKMLAAVEEDGLHYLIMQYVGGGSLRDLLNQQPQLPINRVLSIALELADALTRAHHLRIIHRDLKPANVLLSDDGTPLLTDFGVARLDTHTRMTQTGAVIGTYHYLSPEACMGEVLDARTDIWSFGVMLYEMLAGQTPFIAEQSTAILLAILNNPAPDLRTLRPDTPPALVELIGQMLQKKRDERIGSVRLVGATLESIIQGQDTPHPVSASQPGIPAGESRFATPTPSSPEIVVSTRPLTDQTPEIIVTTPPPAAERPATPVIRRSLTLLPTRTDADGTTRPAWTFIGLGLAAVAVIVALIGGLVLSGGGGGDDDQPGDEAAPAADTTIHTVAPVAPGEVMVLVAQPEPLGDVTPRDVTRFVVDDLTGHFEEEIPFSNIRVRAYPGVITSDEQAQAAVDANAADVIVWGNYTSEYVELEVQVGTYAGPPADPITREHVTGIANVRVRLTDERQESVAMTVIGVLDVLATARNEAFGVARLLAILEELEDGDYAAVASRGATGDLHRALMVYTSDSAGAAEHLTEAITLEPGNPIPYLFRASAYLRVGEYAKALTDIESSQRLGPDDWVTPLYTSGIYATGLKDFEQALDAYDQIVSRVDDDWFAYTYRGALHYLLGDYEQARIDLEKAIALGPEANFPYVASIMVALHDARLVDMQGYLNKVLTEFPDPTFSNRLLWAIYGDQVPNVFGPLIAAASNMVLGQYETAVSDTEAALALAPELADLYMLQGLAQCNLGDFAAAEEAYSRGLEYDAQFAALYALRGEVRMRQGDRAGATADASAALNRADDPTFARLVAEGMAGNWSCESFFSYDYAKLASDETTGPATVPVIEVTPVAPDEYMVLVAQLEPLGGVAERDVTRFIADDLEQRLQLEIPYSQLGVRTYPAIIDAPENALLAAEVNQAAVIVWGHYTPDEIQLEIQVGSLANFAHNAFERAAIERSANVRVRLTDERTESIALPVAGVLNVLMMADADEYNFGVTLAIIRDLAGSGGEPVGNTYAAHIHRGLSNYIDAPETAVEHFTNAINLERGNPFGYAFRGMAYTRLDEADRASTDFATARRLAPTEWGVVLNNYEILFDTLDETIPAFTQMIEFRPDDWYVYSSRGAAYFLAGQLDEARTDINTSIEFNPRSSLPYLIAAMIALRDGQIAVVQDYADTVLARFPDPETMNRIIQVLMANKIENERVGVTFSAITLIMLGQYDDAQADLDRLLGPLAAAPDLALGLIQRQYDPDEQRFMADILLWQGLNFCNLGRDESALGIYDVAQALDPSFAVLYVLRGDMHRRLGNDEQAAADFSAAGEHAPDPEFASWIAAAESGAWTCENFFSYQLAD